MNSEDIVSLHFYQTTSHACSYLPGREAVTVFMDPQQALTEPLYSRLITAGFRRSGTHLYRPGCAHCQACISCRVRVREFEHNKRFKRIWRKNEDLITRELTDMHDNEFFELFCRYIDQRHRDGDMYPPTLEQFQSFIQPRTPSTRFYGFYAEDTLVAVCVLDQLDHALSAMYTFFDPSLPGRSLGVYAILWQIEKSRRLNLPYLYLGYWIKDCAKMSYKTEYRPLELLLDDKWHVLN